MIRITTVSDLKAAIDFLNQIIIDRENEEVSPGNTKADIQAREAEDKVTDTFRKKRNRLTYHLGESIGDFLRYDE